MSSRVFCSAVSTASRFLFFFVLSVTRRRPPLGQFLVGTLNHETVMFIRQKLLKH